ncbi:MAG: AMP-binding protein [Acidobacteria bacterium]|nr:AMP-binding protein [Acidobacteriota bacterium]
MKAYRDITVGALLAALARDYPDREALVYVDRGLRYTFEELESVARQYAKGLLRLGVQKGERVALWATNVPEWIILQFALAKIGAILVTVNTALRAAELEYLLSQSESCALALIQGFRDLDYFETIYQILPSLREGVVDSTMAQKLPHLRHVLYVGNEAPAGMIALGDVLSLGDGVSDQELDAREAQVDVGDVINMQYTSGTTGFPKGVMLTSRNIVNNGYWLGEGLGFTPADRLCLPAPFFHCFGCVIGVLGASTHAACLVPLEYFDPRKVLEYVHKERATAVYGVPTMFLGVLEHPDFDQFDLTSLRTGIMAGAVCPEPLMRRVMTEMHMPEITIAYGLTESSPGITLTPRDDTIEHRTQTVGKVLPEIEVKIIDPVTGETLPPNAPGELCSRGYNTMKGYYNNPEETRRAVDKDGWLHTGDQATIDEEGYVRITGRIKEIIIRGGENIAPREVEDSLRLHPAIADVYVFGIPDEKYGEEVAAAIRLKPGTMASEEEIMAFGRERLAHFKVPRAIRFVETFPMTASGKVQRFKLRELFLKQEPEVRSQESV